MGGAEIVTVLFTDLVGSTELLDRLGDDAAEEVRRVHFGLLREVVAARRGEEVKNVGDGLMVVFASAVDALDAAVGIQRAVARHNRRGLGPPLRVRVGLHVGEPIRAEGDYFGTVVNVAKRLCDAAEPDGILASRLVLELVGTRSAAAVRPVDPLVLKGFAQPVDAVELGWRIEPVDAVAGVDFRVLGPIEATGAGGTAVRLASTRQRLLLACLLARAGQVVGADQLVDALWEGKLPADSKDALQSQVSRLRARLGPGAPIETSPAGYCFTAPDRVDAVRFERLVGDGRRLASDPEAALAVWDAALALWRGEEFLGLAGHPAVRPAAVRLADLRLEAAEGRVAALLGANRLSEALTDSQTLVGTPLLRERSVELRMRVLVATGQRADALAAFEAFRRRMAEETGLDPSPGLRLLQGEILRDQAGPESPAEPTRSARLPATSGAFVGREDAVQVVLSALRRTRLLTLTGPGGMGKTRLALETGHLLADSTRDATWLCELGAVQDDGAVLHALADAVAVRQQPGAPLEESLIGALSDRAALLIVDNCEHVLEGAVPLLERVLARCPGVRILATSRERLAADGEMVVEVLPLEVPAPGEDVEEAWEHPAPALQLLRDRVDAIRPGLAADGRAAAALVDIARRLEGLPLAMELAAPRIAALGPAEVAARLGHRFTLLTGGRRAAPARHRTLRATVEWSYDLLGEAEKYVFERSAVFVGGFTLEAAEGVCAPPTTVGAAESVAEIVATLVDKSVLTVDDRGGTTRYRMLETLREFGLERLATGGGAAEAEESHARRFVDLARRAEAGLRGPDEADWVATVTTDSGNLRAAHLWAVRTGNRRLAAELSGSLAWFSYLRLRGDMMALAEELVADELAAAGPDLARVAFVAGNAAWLRGDRVGARVIADRAIAAAVDDSELCWGLYVRGCVEAHEGDLVAACADYGGAARSARAAGDRYFASLALGTVAVIQGYAGDQPSAVASAAAARVETVRCGAPSAQAWTDYALGEILMQSDPGAALVHLDRAVALAASVQAHFVHGVALVSATSLRARHAAIGPAAGALAEVVDHWERHASWRQQWVTLRHAVELFARAGDAEAVATALGAIYAYDADNLFGADGERMAALREGVLARDPSADRHLGEGSAMPQAEVVAYVRRRLCLHRDGAS